MNVSGVPAGIGTAANYVIITSEFGTGSLTLLIIVLKKVVIINMFYSINIYNISVEMWQTSDLKNSKTIKTLNDTKKIKKIKVIPCDHSFYMLSYFG